MAQSLFISPNRVFKNTLISGDLDADKLVPHIEAAQDVDLFNLIGQNLYEHIDGLIFNKDETDNTSINHVDNANYKNLLIQHIRPYLEQYSAARFLQYARYTVSEKGVFLHSSTEGTVASKEDVEEIINDIIERGERYGNDMYNHICFNTGIYPEYITTSGEQTPPSSMPFDHGFEAI